MAVKGDQQATEQRDKKKEKAEWAAFKRSTSPGACESRTSKMPPEVARVITASNQRSYFEAWLAAGRDWGRVRVCETVTHKDTAKRGRKRQWLTEARCRDIMKSDVVAEALIEAAKKEPKRVRPNPDCPECKEAMEYHVTVEDAEESGSEDEVARGAKMEADLDGEAAETLVRAELADTRARASGGGGSSSGAGNKPGNAAVEHDKEEARKRRIEDAKKKREERENDPVRKAQKWLKNLNVDVCGCRALKHEVDTAETCPDGLRTEYANIFGKHSLALEELRGRVEDVVVGKKEVSAESTLHDANEIVGKYQKDRAAWKQLFNVYAAKAEAPGLK